MLLGESVTLLNAASISNSAVRGASAAARGLLARPHQPKEFRGVAICTRASVRHFLPFPCELVIDLINAITLELLTTFGGEVSTASLSWAVLPDAAMVR